MYQSAKQFFSICLILIFAFSIGTVAQTLVAEGAEIVKLANDFSFTEGPAADAQGNVYFTDQPNNLIYVWTVEGKLDTFHTSPQRANGMYFDNDGALLACADLHNRLVAIKQNGDIKTIVGEYKGDAFNGPNDLWVHPDGSIFFTDPFYQRPWWDHENPPQEERAVYYVSPDRSTLKRVATDFVQPNGIIGTPDGKTLYVADINAGKTFAFDIKKSGELADRRFFAPEGSDGMTIDNRGNVYLTNDGVSVFDPKGNKMTNIEVPERPANVCFGGKENKTLFITARTSLYSLDMQVKGVQ